MMIVFDQVAISVEQCGLHQRIALQALLTIGHQDADFHPDDDDDVDVDDADALQAILTIFHQGAG